MMRILLIVQPDRIDFYNYLSSIPNVEWYLLWYEKPSQMKINPASLPINFRHIYFWTDFATPNKLLKTIKPDCIVFFEIIDLRKIALIVTARYQNVSTFFLEHGAAGDRDTAIERWKEITFWKDKVPYYINRFTKRIWDVIRAKTFYYAVTKGFSDFKSYKIYFTLPLKMMREGPNKVLAFNKFKERVPNKCIVFNEVNYEEFALYTGVSRKDALLTGIPFFDKYFKHISAEKDYIVYIDHPYYEENLVGWTKMHHDSIANSLFEFAEKKEIPLHIKLHPRSNKSLWSEKRFNSKYVTIIQEGDYTELYLEAKLILGFSSSLMTGFLCAKKNIVLLGWHPKPQIFGTDFSKSGLCHVSFSPSDLNHLFEKWVSCNKTITKEEVYENFLKDYNYPFDGKATQRVTNAIIHHGVF